MKKQAGLFPAGPNEPHALSRHVWTLICECLSTC